MVTSEYAKFLPLSKKTEENDSMIYEKYFQDGSVYETKKLTLKSQLILDLNLENGYYSVNYITRAFEAYKKLNHKHINNSQNFDILLGLK